MNEEKPRRAPLPPDEDGANNSESSVDRLQKELYRTEEPAEVTLRRQQLSALGYPEVAETATDAAAEDRPVFSDIAKKHAAQRRKIFLLIGAGALVMLAFVGAAIATVQYRASRQVTEEQVQLTVAAPPEFTVGEILTYELAAFNHSKVGWESVDIFFEPPSGFVVEETEPALSYDGRQHVLHVGTLAPEESRTIRVSGQLVGEQNEVVVAQAEIFLSPENFPSGRFSKQAVASTTISAVPLEVSIQATHEISHGQRLLATVLVRNLSQGTLEDLVLHVEPTVGLQLAPEDEQFSSGFSALRSAWDLPALEPLGEVSRQVVLFAEGQPGERRPLEVRVMVQRDNKEFVQREVSHVLTITASELAIEQTYDGQPGPLVVFPGQELQGILRYSNAGTVGLGDAVVRLQFEGAGLDAASLKLAGGAYDPVSNAITWTAASVPELALIQPQQNGELVYSFKILPSAQFPTAGDSGKQHALVATAVIDSPDLPTPVGQEKKVFSDRAVLSVASELALDATAFFDDGRLGITSSGPVPPEVGQTTTYTVRLRLGSTLNDTGDVRVAAVLPDGVSYTNQTFKTGGEVTHDERTGQVTWTMPQLLGLTGRTAPPQELHFQVAVTPGANVRGNVLPLVTSLTAQAQDLFVDQGIARDVKELPTTETAVPRNGRVQ